ncbi:TrbI/VirB10 family protein [Halodesulfovibrio sp.]|jgi:type IV secretion system protein VirB10|uniref:TrbI/VirB10 family protein n=1 Tax=Halodesulfovibrio sp. TaxID=1912772 RepID=UPI0025EABF9C|nr:TrbI/VirB10 family protein [Halodesulfovibrio sp.]MCT4533768.1 conjugal transfer protein TrbI [Halodesulfovibrio sp.]
MSDTPDPQSLERPKINVTKLNKNIVYFIVAIGIGLLIFLIIEVDRSTTKRATVQETQNAPAPPDNKLPVINPGSSVGLAVPKKIVTPLEETVAHESEPIVVIPTTTRNPALEQQRKEKEDLRKLKWEQIKQAYTSSLESDVNIPTLNSQEIAYSQPSTPAQQKQSVLATAIPYGKTDRQLLPSEKYNPADQRDKETFLSTRSHADSQWTLQHSRKAGAPFELKTGTLISGIMLSGINSDLPGQIIGQVSRNIYDFATGDHLLIPQGSRMIGVYDSRIVSGQSRLLIAWNRIVFPDGSSITLDSMPGADMAGYSGVSDQTDNHYLRIYGSAVIMSLISGATAFASDSFGNNSSDNEQPTLQSELGSALSSQLGQTTLRVLEQNMNIQPTLTIRPGSRFNMVLIKDIVFRSPYVSWR